MFSLSLFESFKSSDFDYSLILNFRFFLQPIAAIHIVLVCFYRCLYRQ